METLWTLLYLLEPAPATLIVTAVTVMFAFAFRALNYGKEMERNLDFSEASITLDSSQALLIPVMSSCSLLLMFFLFSSVSQLLRVFTAIASVPSLFYWLSPYAISIKTQFGLSDPFFTRCSSKCFTRIQGLLLVACALTVVAWLSLMLLALVLCFDHRKSRDVVNIYYPKSSKGHKYIWYALPGYAIGVVAALAAGVLTHSPQPLYFIWYHLL